MVMIIGMLEPPNCAGAPSPPHPAISLIGLLEALGRAHDAVLEMATFLVAGLVERLQHFLAELRGVDENVVDQLGRKIGELRQVALLLQFQELVHQKAKIVDGGAIDRHA